MRGFAKKALRLILQQLPATALAGSDQIISVAAAQTVTGAKTFDAVALAASELTTGTMTAGYSAQARQVISKFTWTNAQIVALGAALTGDITICTLPAKTVVSRVWLVVDSAAAGPATLTASIGRTGALYTDYLGASSLKAAANTIYGATPSYTPNADFPSNTAATDVKMHLTATVANLNMVLSSTGTVYLETYSVA